MGSGPAQTPDSRYYLAAAHSWATTRHLLNPDGTTYVFWGPLYPVLLAAAGAVRTPALAVPMLHAVCLLGSWAGWTWLSRKMLGTDAAWPAVVPWVLAFSTPWLMAAKFIWAESVFLLLFTAYAAALYGYLTSRQHRWLVLATVAGFLLPLQRTTGLFLLAGTAVGLLVGYGWQQMGRRRGILVWHLLASLSGGVAWQAWVARSQHDEPLVVYAKAAWGLQPLSDFSFVLTRWVVPLPVPAGSVSWGFLLAGAALLGLLVLGAGNLGRFGWVLLITVATYIGWHVVAHVLSRGAAGLHDGERYAGAVFGPVVLLLSGAIRALAGRHPRWLLVVLLLWLMYPAARAVRNSRFLHQLPTTLAAAAE
ncbi:hypothetical protein [Hymenobacter canadensis]|uniref:Glycosyltransferase RgtA/B/C/D-like domain-containing protein n=1 Tax=Hymenobacter canadensis TaxID=2999067 RepID=A0ABY7LPC2_9BACT|nr:hypothetical protein [Hymenobacter canadensis]WBA42268.1 hypothetical protein O3303_01630 [Hymenobacter canadensis]